MIEQKCFPDCDGIIGVCRCGWRMAEQLQEAQLELIRGVQLLKKKFEGPVKQQMDLLKAQLFTAGKLIESFQTHGKLKCTNVHDKDKPENRGCTSCLVIATSTIIYDNAMQGPVAKG